MTTSRLLAAVLLAAAPAARALDVGAPVPTTTMRTLDGRELALPEELRERPAVVVLFLSTVCPYAAYYETHFAEMWSDHQARGVLFVGVYSNATEPAEEVLRHAAKKRLGFPMVKDEGARVADALGARHTPEAFLFDRNGTLRYRGRIEGKESKLRSPDLRNALDDVLNGAPVRVTEAKAFGCAIVRR